VQRKPNRAIGWCMLCCQIGNDRQRRARLLPPEWEEAKARLLKCAGAGRVLR
jgi:hypothetical protein